MQIDERCDVSQYSELKVFPASKRHKSDGGLYTVHQMIFNVVDILYFIYRYAWQWCSSGRFYALKTWHLGKD